MADWDITEKSFNLFLSWLDPDRDSAGKKLVDIRRRLSAMLDARGCPRSDELVDEALKRFIHRLPSMIDSFTDDPIPYLLVTARNVHLEYSRKEFLPLPEVLPSIPVADDDVMQAELFDACLEECLGKLDLKERALVLDYYRGEKQAKINFRKELANSLGLSANALRIKVHYLRNTLHECLDDCLALKLPEMK